MDNEIKTMSANEYFMRMVYLVASRSKDIRTKIGSILVIDNEVISTGYNGFPKGVLDLKERYENRELKYKFVAHSEFNSIVLCARKGIKTLGATLFTQGAPCSECCKAVIQAGISKIVVHKQWPNLTYSEKWVESFKVTQTMLKEANVTIEYFDKVLGLKGFLDGKEIEV